MQLLEVLCETDLQVFSSKEEKKKHPVMKRLKNIIGHSPLEVCLDDWEKTHHTYLEHLWCKSADWAKRFDFPGECTLALVDDPIYFEPILRRLKQAGVKVVGVCHNIESLSGFQVAPGKQQKLLNRELVLLAECDLVITISREETFLLHNLGVATCYFPYFPAEEIRDRLVKVRSRRHGTVMRDVLMVGTAGNVATRQGMKHAIRSWHEKKLSQPGRELLVAGYGTETLATCETDGVRFLGPLSDQELDKLLGTVKACLCYQEQASGALTRIPEMLVAGVPVLANSHAARSYYNLAGVSEFSDFDELGAAIEVLENQDYDVPSPVVPDAKALRDVVMQLAG